MTETRNSRKKSRKTIKDMLKMIEKERKKGKSHGNIDNESECYRSTGAVEEGEKREEEKEEKVKFVRKRCG